MELTEGNKMYIDSLDYVELLRQWRFAPIGNPWFQGETGDYLKDRMFDLRSKEGGQEMHTKASKQLGWDK